MESVMNFLADYYIWFFVVAGILCIALIGFIAESKKKQKNEFKGESIEENSNSSQSAPAQTVPEDTMVVSDAPVMEAPSMETPSMETPSVTPEAPSVNETIEINDIPISTPEQSTTESTPIEFYSGPVEMPKVEPSVSEAPVVNEPQQEVNQNNNIFGSTPTMDIGYQQVNDLNSVPPVETPDIQTEAVMPENNTVTPEAPTETPTTNIFDDIK